MNMNRLIARGASSRNTWRGPQLLLHTTILALTALSLLPVYLMISISFKNPLQYQHERWGISFPLRLGNYSAAWDMIGGYMWNTVIVAVVGFLGMIILSVIGAYVFARMRFPFRQPLYYALIALLMVPWVISFIPAYMLYSELQLLNSRWALIIPNIAGGPIFGIFLLRSFFEGLPEEIYEAARMDGAGHFTLILRITLPLSLPIIATLAVLNFIGTWNSFLWPLVAVNDDALQVISVGLYRLSSQFAGDASVWGPLFAGYVVASVPLAVLFLGLGKFYVEGLVQSGVQV